MRAPAQLVDAASERLFVTATSGTLDQSGELDPQVYADADAAALAFAESCEIAAVDGCPTLTPGGAPLEVLSTEETTEPGEATAIAFEVTLLRRGASTIDSLVIDVRIEFGEGLDRYDITAG